VCSRTRGSCRVGQRRVAGKGDEAKRLRVVRNSSVNVVSKPASVLQDAMKLAVKPHELEPQLFRRLLRVS